VAHVKVNVSLDGEVVSSMRRRAEESGLTVSGYLSRLVAEDARRAQDELAAEGYRALSEDLKAFAGNATAIAHEVWPEWPESKARARPRPGGARVG